MYVTEKNLRIADGVVEILIKEECTVDEAQKILADVSRRIAITSTVQMTESYKEMFSDALQQKE